MMNKKRVLNVGYGKIALVAEYYKGNMSSRHFYGSIELEKCGKYDVQNISLDSRQNIKGNIHNNLLMLKKSDTIFVPYFFVAPFFLLAIVKHLRLSNKKIIAICHTTMKQGNGMISKIIYKKIYDVIDIVFFHSQKNMEESINNKSIKSSKARFLYWGDDLEYVDKMFPNLTTGDFFISTGREQRDYQTIVSAFSKNNISLEIYTNKINYDTHYDYLDEVKDKYENIKVEYVERTNRSTVKLAKRTSECLCVVIPIIKENINYCVGLTSLIEAMAMSKPVICTYNPYSPIDIEKEGIGLVVNGHRTWEEAISYIYNHREEAIKMGQRGRELAEKLFNIKKCTEQIEGAINE
jgi:glycosyltransferase involved in cell wall biosynthesis